jgi:hypothetical protein
MEIPSGMPQLHSLPIGDRNDERSARRLFNSTGEQRGQAGEEQIRKRAQAGDSRTGEVLQRDGVLKPPRVSWSGFRALLILMCRVAPPPLPARATRL